MTSGTLIRRGGSNGNGMVALYGLANGVLVRDASERMHPQGQDESRS